jgi:hypothetical protein
VFLGYSNLHKGYKCLDISTGRLYISRDIVFDEAVFPFATLHSNARARLREEINLLPLSLQPFNLHYHEWHELQGPGDIDPTNATNIAAESFLQSTDQDFTSDDDSSDFPAPCTDPGTYFPAPVTDPGTDSVQSGAESSPGVTADGSALEGALQRGSTAPACPLHRCRVWIGGFLLAGPLMPGCRLPPALRPDLLRPFLPASR